MMMMRHREQREKTEWKEFTSSSLHVWPLQCYRSPPHTRLFRLCLPTMPCVAACLLPLVHKASRDPCWVGFFDPHRVRLFIHTSPNQPDFHSNQTRVRLKKDTRAGVKAAIVTGVGGLWSKVRSKRPCCVCWSPSNSVMNGTLTDEDVERLKLLFCGMKRNHHIIPSPASPLGFKLQVDGKMQTDIWHNDTSSARSNIPVKEFQF